MPNGNLTLEEIVFAEGMQVGEKINQMIKNGTLSADRNLTVGFNLSNITIQIPTAAKIAAKFGSCEFADIGNSGIVVAGLTTGGIALLRIQTSKGKTAAVFYTLSFLFSSAAVGTGSVAVLARECQISAPAALSEAFGTGFLFLGHEANRVANNIEGIQTSPEEYGRFLRRMSRSNSHPKGASFVMPGCGYDISNQDIVVVVSVIATVYTYGKIVIKLYRFAQQKIHKYRETREARRLLREKENEKTRGLN